MELWIMVPTLRELGSRELGAHSREFLVRSRDLRPREKMFGFVTLHSFTHIKPGYLRKLSQVMDVYPSLLFLFNPLYFSL